jgi:glycosyltransferase involved in cell wall biosynthesis
MHRNDQMKIVHVISNLGNGGAEKFVVELANEQAKNHDVSIISFRNVEDWMFPPKKIQPTVSLFQLGKQSGFNVLFLIRLIVLLRRLKPDILNCHLDATLRYVYIVSFFVVSAKYIQTVHSSLHSGKVKFFNNVNYLPFFNKRFVNVCISESICREYKNKYKKMNFQNIDNAVVQMSRSDNFSEVKGKISHYKKNNEKVFVAVGSFSDLKNFVMLAELFKRLKKENKNVLLFIIGGNWKDEVQKQQIGLIEKIKCDNTFLLGPKENVGDYLFLADAFILSSKFEGMPIALLEALSVGLPIVATPAGGVKDIVQNKINGFVADGIEEEDLYIAVKHFLTASSPMIQKIKINNLNLFNKQFSFEKCSRQYINLYNRSAKMKDLKK